MIPIVLVLLCVACVTGHGTPTVFLSDSAAYALLPASALDAPLDMLQHISGAHAYGQPDTGKETQTFSLDAWVSADDTHLTLTLLNDFGTGMGVLTYHDGRVRLSSAFFPRSLNAAYIIADFQLCFYRLDALVPALADAGLSLNAKSTATGETRVIRDGDAVLITIEKTPAEVRYTNHLRGYHYTIQGDFS